MRPWNLNRVNLIDSIIEASNQLGIDAGYEGAQEDLDHGAMIPFIL